MSTTIVIQATISRIPLGLPGGHSVAGPAKTPCLSGCPRIVVIKHLVKLSHEGFNTMAAVQPVKSTLHWIEDRPL